MFSIIVREDKRCYLHGYKGKNDIVGFVFSIFLSFKIHVINERKRCYVVLRGCLRDYIEICYFLKFM